MNCGKLKPTALRMLIAAVMSAAIMFFVDGPTDFFKVFVVYMLNYLGLSVWAIGQELNERLKASGGYLEGDVDDA